MHDIEENVRFSFQADFQEQVDDLTRTRDSTQVRMQELHAEFQAQNDLLRATQKQASEMRCEMGECRQQLAEAERTVAQQAQARELQILEQSARRMRKSLGDVTRRSSFVSSSSRMSSMNSSESPRRRASQDLRPRRQVSILDEVRQNDGVDQLQLENYELAEQVHHLQSQLQDALKAMPTTERISAPAPQRAQQQVQPPAEGGAGADAAGGTRREEAASTAKSAAVVDALQEQLEQAKQEIAEANARLRSQRRHEQIAQLTSSDALTAEQETAAKEEAEESSDLWGWYFHRIRKQICCSRAEQRNWPFDPTFGSND